MLVWVEVDVTQILIADFVHNEENNAAALSVGSVIVSRGRKVPQAKNKMLEYLTAYLTYLDAT